MISYVHDPLKALALADVFNVALPFAGILGDYRNTTRSTKYLNLLTGVPVVAYLLDKQGSFVTSNTLLVTGIVFGLLGVTERFATQLLQILILVVFRPLMYTFGMKAAFSMYSCANPESSQ